MSLQPPRHTFVHGVHRLLPPQHPQLQHSRALTAQQQALAPSLSSLRHPSPRQCTPDSARVLNLHTPARHHRRKRLQKMISTMRERMEAKLGNSNNNAFRMRKLFKMYDKTDTGRVHFEDFRNMAETFGMQLDDDSLMALYFVYDPEVGGVGGLT